MNALLKHHVQLSWGLLTVQANYGKPYRQQIFICHIPKIYREVVNMCILSRKYIQSRNIKLNKIYKYKIYATNIFVQKKCMRQKIYALKNIQPNFFLYRQQNIYACKKYMLWKIYNPQKII